MKLAGPILLFASLMALATGNGFAATTSSDKDVVLVSNSRAVVTRADFEMEMERVPSENRFEFLASRDRIGKMLEEILIVKTLASEARELGLDKQPHTLMKMERAQERVLAEERSAHLAMEAKLPDFELRAKEVYRLNPEKYTDKPKAHAYHILIGLNGRSKEEAFDLAKKIQAEALNGANFEELAVKYSDDKSSKEKKGDLGYFTPGEMIKPFSDAVFALKKGEISAPVESKFGYHIIKLIDIKPGNKQEYKDVKEQIIKELKDKYLAEFKTKHITAIRVDKEMKINEDEIMKIKTTLPTIESSK